jgi:steroid delta-isomerase-like uncharacterized protein
MSEFTSTNKALMRRIYEEMWNKHNPAYAAEIFLRPERVEKFVRRFLQSFSDLQHTVQSMIAEDDQVVVRFSAQGTHTREWMGVSATGKSIHYTGVTWARIADTKIVEHHTWWEEASLIEQILSKDHPMA